MNTIKEPPKTFFGTLSHLGPSMILSASIVGSGELIMTTTLGARAGFVALWVILLSCLVKVTVQLEFGKHAINSGETSMQALGKLPGPTILRAHWTIWMWFIVQLMIVIQYGGIAEGIAQGAGIILPALPGWVWITLAGIITAALIGFGYYRVIEGVSLGLMVIFTLFTLLCVVLLQSTQYAISASQIADGFRFQLPGATLGVAIAAFGLTGVGASEIVAYPYWCLEKGYASYTGAYEQSEKWARRAKGWIRVMYWDGVISMVVYTLVTASFYVLGAAVLHGQGYSPSGSDMILTLSRIYTESAGPGVMMIYVIGAIVVLFSTLFAGSAAWSRMFSDAFAQVGLLDYSNKKQLRHWIRHLAWIIPLAWVTAALTSAKVPVIMVTIGGVGNASLLLVVVFAAFIFRYKRLAPELRPSKIYDLFLWTSFIAITAVGVLAIIKLFN